MKFPGEPPIILDVRTGNCISLVGDSGATIKAPLAKPLMAIKITQNISDSHSRTFVP